MDQLEEVRSLSFAVAYRMLGSISEAEDVVQDALIRFHEADGIENPDAFMTTVTTRLAIDALRSARMRREVYVGAWLPEPLVEEFSAQQQIESEETISIAFLMLLEQLSPEERAVLILREAFGYEFAEIGEVVGKSETNCRQILSRARSRIGRDEPRFEAEPEQMEALTDRFLVAARDGDLDDLLDLLSDDVVMTGDGGGKARALAEPLAGSPKVARALMGFAKLGRMRDVSFELCRVNGQPGILTRDSDGKLINVIAIVVEDGRVGAVNSILNPDKLAHIGPISDLGLRSDYTDRD